MISIKNDSMNENILRFINIFGSCLRLLDFSLEFVLFIAKLCEIRSPKFPLGPNLETLTVSITDPASVCS